MRFSEFTIKLTYRHQNVYILVTLIDYKKNMPVTSKEISNVHNYRSDNFLYPMTVLILFTNTLQKKL